jgi:hypothetical protein
MTEECPLIRMLDAIPYIFDSKVDKIERDVEKPGDRPFVALETIRDVLEEESSCRFELSTIFICLAETRRFVDEDGGLQKMLSQILELEKEDAATRDQNTNKMLDTFMTAPRLKPIDPWRCAVSTVRWRTRIPGPKYYPKCVRLRPCW